MKLVLDTSSLWHPDFLDALAEASAAGAMEDGRVVAILPAVAYGERLRQIERTGRDAELWKRSLGELDVVIEPFGVREAERLSAAGMDEPTWRRHARDALIAAHVTQGRFAVTADAGPIWRTLPSARPDETAANLRSLLSPRE